MPNPEFDYESVRKELTRVFLSAVKVDGEFHQALGIVKDDFNVCGKRFLIGGFIYRTLIKAVHNPSLPHPNELDFLVGRHKPLYNFNLPSGFLWEDHGSKNKHVIVDGSSRLIRFSTFSTFHPIARHAMKCNIDSYLENVPFNLNSIAFDLETNQILGFGGVEGVSTGVLKIHNPGAATYYARKHREMSLDQHIMRKAQDLGIGYEL